ncbi:hypothetical protein L541_2544 [Bordetella hinzii CA90 BAL1384]|uniref:Uncharacterized protein n=1 Tax=Bordetella hinzii OH87 BAL007II TaxID=1331262 RepID=A0ABR4R0Q4_9BORD|nr:hypothetical protein L544_2191 [Bordetella hinzii OH87 BAL007II]KCB27595.1 hypothetical protein L541_2544 [Bordetella hinzii CA90 BAL1384]KCB40618.1 hypothetical protein L539_2501 [Bordetella hinzii 5132]KCB41970.1 hypothetical protein L538_2409 [Bordetella hinzii 4161]KCB51480.1 hypothetical protein L537_2538 [Bordetella hinzii 1277]
MRKKERARRLADYVIADAGARRRHAARRADVESAENRGISWGKPVVSRGKWR